MSTKKPVKKTAPAPQRIIREFTPAERAKWQRAVAEETTPAARDAAQKAMHGIRRGRAALHDAFKLLRQERERQGLSLADMQARAGIDRSTLSGLENAESPNPTIGTLARLADALGKTIEITLR